MVRVGVPADIDEQLLSLFPKEAELIRIDPAGKGEIAVEIWVAPLHSKDMAAVSARLRGVKLVQSLWAGVDALLPFVPAGATLCDAQGVHDVPVAEWIVAGIFATLKHLPFYVCMQERGRWEKDPAAEQGNRQSPHEHRHKAPPLSPEELAGKTVLIVGYGAIGRALEERLRAVLVVV